MLKTLFVTIDEFLANGGILKEGQDIYREERRHFDTDKFDSDELLKSSILLGTCIEKDEKQGAYLIKNSSYRSFPITGTIGYIRITAKVEYI